MNRTVSVCAIMLLVDRVTEIVAQSYGTDAALLAALRASWPPAEAPTAGATGYRRIDLAKLEPAGAVRLTDRFGVALAAEPGGTFAPVPIVREGDGAAGPAGTWRRAGPGDGISALVAGVPLASERPVGVDQTHDSVVVGERAIVKWFRRVGPEPTRAALLVAHLAAVGFDGIPTPLGSLAWRSPSGVELTLAEGDEFLPGARDGWEWCVERAADDDRSVGPELGQLVRRLHEALATPSPVIPAPTAAAGATDVDRWRRGATAILEDALEGTVDPELDGWAPAMRSAIEALPAGGDAAIQPVHGDLHVGQVLEWPGGLAVIDFDGNPTLPDEANAVRQPRERDVAQIAMSLDHVGRVVEERGGGDRSGWIEATRAAFLEAVGPVDERLLAAFEVEQECRELVYAARFLPRWRYAPMAALRARFGGE
jgi:maltokinase